LVLTTAVIFVGRREAMSGKRAALRDFFGLLFIRSS